MRDIDSLEHGGGGFAIRRDGVTTPMLDPRAIHFQHVLMVLDAQHVPGTPPGVPDWQRDLIFERWRLAWDLPTLNEALRLAYLVDHYRRQASYDLRVTAGVDLGELWRERRWQHLLDLLDHLPAHTHFQAATIEDDEHAEMAAKSIVERERQQRRETGKEVEATPPSQVGFTPEVAMIAKVVDAVNGLNHTTILANSERATIAPPKPEPRPQSAIERAVLRERFRVRQEKHESLAARVLRRKN